MVLRKIQSLTLQTRYNYQLFATHGFLVRSILILLLPPAVQMDVSSLLDSPVPTPIPTILASNGDLVES
jgi:hypothetical protein